MEDFSEHKLKLALEKKSTGQELSPLDFTYLLWYEYKGSQSRLEQDYNETSK